MNSHKIRQSFLDFFASKNHNIVPSAPMVLKNDPTLMFTNAGMNQFKEIFLGQGVPSHLRVADTQKCLRVSGKHNDLEEVGIDTYHHTMFEMLGNWSFGDYFKKEAIGWAWELLTEVLKIDKDRLYVTVFKGDKHDGLAEDREAFGFWKEWISEDRILYGSKKDNFWEMGDTGPCGPCSEIHVDLRDAAEIKQHPGHELVNTGHPLVIEIWNLVFIEFNRMADGKLVSLPAKHVDTGMGFERLCMVLQGKKSNYDTDVFQPLIQEIAIKAGVNYGEDPKKDVAMRVMADHLRAVAFAIADGQLPSNVKAGYVIRRILRRAVRYGCAFLGFNEPVMTDLVEVLAHQLGDVFPELRSQLRLIRNVIREEESSFLRTLENGTQRFNNYIGQTIVPEGQERIIDGAFAFELFDTYGFPIDLTQLMAREQGWMVDMEGFKIGLVLQKERSRKAAATDTSDWTVLDFETFSTVFVGYDVLSTNSNIVKFRKVTGKDETLYHVVLDETPFYAEAGGQIGDKGWLITGNSRIPVLNTLKENNLIIHVTPAIPINPAEPVLAVVDEEKRLLTANNHSATHLLHAALRKVLGPHVEQKGSLVDENRLRFDFTHFSKMTPQEIREVEQIVNARIRANIPVGEAREVPFDEAKAMGAMALFGEKYGKEVRVITFDPSFSVELCGGTHVPATGQIGLFRIVSESAIAAGVRRIEAITAVRSEEAMYHQEEMTEQIREALKHPKDLLRSIHSLVEENQQLRKIAGEYEKIRLAEYKAELRKKIRTIGEVSFIAEKVDLQADAMKNLGFDLRGEMDHLFLVLASETEGKANLLVALSEDLVKEKRMNAGQIIRELAKEIDGGGGGQPHIATAGGKNPSGIPNLLTKAESYVQ